MSADDPTDTFRQEARELLEQLEQGLLDLEQNPGDTDLINSTFRALHTIKGSGAMFGFTAVAEFVHEFETAFDRVRKGQSTPTPALIAVALDAKDHIHKLIQAPEASQTGGEPILAALRVAVAGGAEPAATPEAPAPVEDQSPAAASGRWRIVFRLPADALVNGTNPLLLLDEIREIGPAEIAALTDAVPALDGFDPEKSYFGWQVDLTADDPRAAIDDVFMFIRDGMELSVSPLAE
jgi:two-component system chemotaxis sensor kinase CheA